MQRHDCLFILPSFRHGGAEKVVIRILNALAESGLDVGLVVIDDSGELRGLVAPGVPVYDLRTRKTRQAPLHLIMLIWRLKPRVIFSSLTRVNLLLLFVRRLMPGSVKIVIRQPSIASIEMRDLKPSWLYRSLMPRLLPTADAIVSQSKAMTMDLRTVLNNCAQLITTINNPAPEIDRSRYLDAKSPYAEGHNFLSVGRLSFEKGPDVLLKAFARVLETLPSSRLTFVGDGPLLSDMRKLTDDLNISGSVRFLGYIADPYLYYVHADAVVLASRREGFPNVLVEAVTSGVPVVATECGGVSKEIVIDGENGFLVPGENPARLADAMVEAIALRQKRSAASIAQTSQRFAANEVFLAYRRVILEVCHEPCAAA